MEASTSTPDRKHGGVGIEPSCPALPTPPSTATTLAAIYIGALPEWIDSAIDWTSVGSKAKASIAPTDGGRFKEALLRGMSASPTPPTTPTPRNAQRRRRRGRSSKKGTGPSSSADHHNLVCRHHGSGPGAGDQSPPPVVTTTTKSSSSTSSTSSRSGSSTSSRSRSPRRRRHHHHRGRKHKSLDAASLDDMQCFMCRIMKQLARLEHRSLQQPQRSDRTTKKPARPSNSKTPASEKPNPKRPSREEEIAALLDQWVKVIQERRRRLERDPPEEQPHTLAEQPSTLARTPWAHPHHQDSLPPLDRPPRKDDRVQPRLTTPCPPRHNSTRTTFSWDGYEVHPRQMQHLMMRDDVICRMVERKLRGC